MKAKTRRRRPTRLQPLRTQVQVGADFNRYYIGAQPIANSVVAGKRNGWAWPTIEEAIAHARKYLEEDATGDAAIIVRIECVVRRKDTPVVVEKV